MNSEINRLKNERCDILIATPGRLLDHLDNGGLQSKFANLQSLILDEADRLLDQGFLNELQKIFVKLPSRDVVPRQAMLFSATMSKEVKQVRAGVWDHNHDLIKVFDDRLLARCSAQTTSSYQPLQKRRQTPMNTVRPQILIQPHFPHPAQQSTNQY